jgi:diguanylate cyclase (GGDEF)-like protein
VAFTDLRIFNRSVEPDPSDPKAVLPAEINHLDRLQLPADATVFSIGFSGLHFAAPERNRYMYRLNGLHQDWIEADSRSRLATFTNLDPGSYELNVRAANKDGAWSDPRSLRLVLLPPWWKSWWARSLLAVVSIGLLAMGYHWRVRSIKAQQVALRQAVAERTETIAEQNRQLQSLDRIVRTINMEVDLAGVLLTLLEQGGALIGQVRSGLVLLAPGEKDPDHFRVASVWQLDRTLVEHKLPKDAVVQRYLEAARSLDKDFYLIEGDEPRVSLPPAPAELAMAVYRDSHLSALVIYQASSFDSLGIERVARLREHVNSAISRARLMDQVSRTNEQLVTVNQRLQQWSTTDFLTRLSNRRDFVAKANVEFQRFARHPRPLCLMLADLDDFKALNDEHGHDCGDAVLVEVAQRLRRSVRSEAVVGRWGGEEFVLLLPETSAEEARLIGGRILDNFKQTPIVYRDLELMVQLTMGVCEVVAGMDLEMAIKHADQALLKGKEQGKAQVVMS